MKTILYRILTLFILTFGGTFFFIFCIVIPFLHYMAICPVTYLLTGKWLTADYIDKFLDFYIDFFKDIEKKGDYD